MRTGTLCRLDRGHRPGFTLIEVLLVVVILGIAGVLVIPSMSQANVLRVQSAVRTLVSDVTFLQSDAVAFQSRRAVWFGMVPRWDDAQERWVFVEGNGYTLAEVNGAELDLASDALEDPDRPGRPLSRNFADPEFAGAQVFDADFNGGALLIFDELGGPVEELDGPEPGNGGSVMVSGSGAVFRVDVQAYTGRIVVTKTQDSVP
ncbi:MAG: prepilin-type N-terminal cleavage/methylation domain-containing protein [Planctomycetota bacterium]|nr:prepilin-type N-terminal cleavage/methylation domain-containing protein [Planctomycetota bacterium]